VIIALHEKYPVQGRGLIEIIRLQGNFFLDLTEKINYISISASGTSYLLHNTGRKVYMKILRSSGITEEVYHGI